MAPSGSARVALHRRYTTAPNYVDLTKGGRRGAGANASRTPPRRYQDTRSHGAQRTGVQRRRPKRRRPGSEGAHPVPGVSADPGSGWPAAGRRTGGSPGRHGCDSATYRSRRRPCRARRTPARQQVHDHPLTTARDTPGRPRLRLAQREGVQVWQRVGHRVVRRRTTTAPAQGPPFRVPSS